MRNLRKKILLVFLLLALFSLAGCSSNDVNNGDQTNGNTPAAVESNDDIPSQQQPGQEPGADDNANQGNVDQARAEEIALTHAGFDRSAITLIKSELDHEDGVMVYEIEFKYNGKEYEYKIHAETGEILKAEVDD